MCIFQCLKNPGPRNMHWGCVLLLLLSPALVATADLVLYLPFEDADNPIDASADPTKVVVHGSLNSVDGKIGKGLEFDGDNANRVEVTHAAKLEGMSALTIAAWVLPRNLASHEGMSIVSKRIAWENADVYNLFIWTDQLVNGRVNANNTNIGLSTIALEDNTWYHIALIFDGQGNADEKIKLYINGILESSDDHPGNAVNEGGAPVWVGELDAARGFAWDGIIDEVRLYNHALSEVEILSAMEGKPWPYAFGPDPVDGALLSDTWVNLSWTPGALAVSHDVYIGDNFDAVNEGAESTFIGNQAETFAVIGFPGFHYPDGLVPGTTYYWRIDEVNDTEPNSPWKGPVWSFSIPPKTAYFPDPADGAELVDLDAKLNWTVGFGAKLHYVYFGENFDDVNNATSGLPQGVTTYTPPGPLKLAQTYYWRVDEFDIIDTYKGNVWSFTTEGAVGDPNPANGALDVKQTQIITFSPSIFAASHQVYFGTDKDAVKNADTGSPEYKGTRDLGAESYDPGMLLWDTTYYWRVDEINDTNPDSPWTGILWSFTTAGFLVVDDFESYNDLDPTDPESNRIFNAWIDGYDDPTNGSLVGYDAPPFAEQTIVHSGSQSMPLFYDNSVGYSEATLTLTYPRDWTENGVNMLTIWFRGISDNAAEALYVALNGNAVVTHDDPDAVQIETWTEWIIDLSAPGGFVDQGVNLANVNTITLGLGNKNNPQAGGSGTMYFDDIRLYAPEPAVP